MAACVTPVAPDMSVKTRTRRVVNHRRNIIRLMIAEHPESCIFCSKGNRCQLRQLAAQHGVGETNLYPMPNATPLEQANPFIIRDLSKCILCGKCIRADHELVVVGAIDYNHRGFRSRPATAHETDLIQSNCTFCGTCVSICPTGALAPKNHGYVGTPARESFTICGFCGVGCKLAMGAVNNKIVEVNPAHDSDSVNRATLCVRGHFAHDFLNTAQRITGPLVLKEDKDAGLAQVPASWDTAIDLVADRLKSIIAKNGPQSIGFLGSSKCTLQENYLFQKIARAYVKTNNIDNGGYASGQSLPMQLDEKSGGRWQPPPLADLEDAEAILVVGADPSHSLPVVSYYLKRAARKGIPLVVVDPRKTELVKWASAWLPVSPQSDLELLNALAALLHTKGGYDTAYIDKYTEGFSRYQDNLSALDMDRACRVTGLEMGGLERAAAMLTGKKLAIVVGHGILQQRHGNHSLGAIINLSLMTGGFASRGAGLYLLARENNQVGAMDMGTIPNLLPGRRPLSSKTVRKSWERAWKTALAPDPGLNMVQMIEAAEKGDLKALYIMGENPLRALPEPDRVQAALKNLEFLVVQDILHGETTAIAHVVLPGAAFSEKGGAFTNLEGRIQSFDPVIEPIGKARPDWEILDLLTEKLGNPARYGDLAKIDKEIRGLVPMYAELGRHAQGWATGSRVDDAEKDLSPGRISFSPVVSTADMPVPEDYPMTAILGSHRYHLGSGTRTGHSKRIQTLNWGGEMEMSFEDARAMALGNGDKVTITSAHGAVTRAVRLSTKIRPGQVFIPTGFNKNQAMALIGLHDLSAAETPGWKTCPVRLEKAWGRPAHDPPLFPI